MSQAVFIEFETAGGKRIAFNNVAASVKEACVNLFNHRGFSEHQVFVAPFCGLAPVVFGSELITLNIRAHCPVKDQDTLS